jgi:hypothetical protein
MFFIWGRRAYGRVDAHGGEHAHTVFYHLYFMPLIPTMSVWNVAPGRGFGTRWNAKSVIATYLRMWGPVAALGCFVSGVLPVMLVGTVFAAISVAAWFSRGVRDQRRSDFDRLAFGARCEPTLMYAEMRTDLKRTLDARWAKLELERSPDEVAHYGARSLEEAVIAYGLLRLAAVEDHASNAAANRILAGTYEAPPTGDGPYREEPAEPIPAAVIEQVQAAAAALRPPIAPGLASKEPWWTFSANTLAATLVVAVIGLAIIVSKSSTLRGPQSITAEQIAAGLGNDEWVKVECVHLESLGRSGEDKAGFVCDMGDRVLPILADASAAPTSPISGVLLPDNHEHGEWSQYARNPVVVAATLDVRSILLIQAIVIVCIAYEAFFAGLIGFWLVRRFRRS